MTTTKIYNKKAAAKTYKMICKDFGHLFNFTTDNPNEYVQDHKAKHGITKKDQLTYEEVK